MRFIKNYSTEDVFAEMENNSGYPANAVTSIMPGMAYVKESKNVYYNEKPLPPPPEPLKLMSFGGFEEIYYNNEEPSSKNTALLYFDASSRSAITSLTMFGAEYYWDTDSQKWVSHGTYSRPFFESEMGPITINEGDAYFFAGNQDSPSASIVFSASTLGETATLVSGTTTFNFKIFYVTSPHGDQAKFYAVTRMGNATEGWSQQENNLYGLGNERVLFQYIGDGSSPLSWNDLQDLNSMGFCALVEFQNEAEPFPYIPSAIIKEHYEYENNIYDGCSYNSFVNVEKNAGGTYNLLEVNGVDVSSSGFTVEADTQYMISLNDRMLAEMTKSGDVIQYVTNWSYEGFQPYSVTVGDKTDNLFLHVYSSRSDGKAAYYPGDGQVYYYKSGGDRPGYREIPNAVAFYIPEQNVLPTCDEIDLDDIPDYSGPSSGGGSGPILEG